MIAHRINFDQIRRFLIVLGFALLVITLPLSKGICSGAMAGLLILGLPDLPRLKISFHRAHVAYFVVSGQLIFYLVSILYSDDKAGALKFCFRQNTLLVLPVIWVLLRYQIRPYLLLYLKCFIYSCAFASALTLLLFVLPETATQWITAHLSLLQPYVHQQSRVKFGLYSPFIDRLHFSYLLGLAVLGLFWIRQRKPWSILLTLSTLAITIALILLGARGAQLGVLLTLFILVATWIYHSYLRPRDWSPSARWLFLSVIGIVYFVVTPVVLYHVSSPVRERYDQLFWELKLFQSGEYQQWDYSNFTSVRRIASFYNHLKLIRRKPITGTGVGDYRADLQSVYHEDANLNLDANAQNQYLFIWASSGVLAFCYFLWTLYFIFRKARKIPDTWSQALAVSTVVFFAFISLFDIFIAYQIGSMAFALCACLIAEGSVKS